MAIADRKLREKQEMQKLILDAAFKLFTEEGFNNISIRRIAEHIEYSPATIYLYFKDKDEILHALHKIGFEKLYLRELEAESVKDPVERLNKIAEVYLDFALKNPEYYDLMFIMRGPVKKREDFIGFDSEHDSPHGFMCYDILLNTVQACVNAGYLAHEDAEVASFALWASMHGLAALIIRRRCPMMEEEESQMRAIKAREMISKLIVLSKSEQK